MAVWQSLERVYLRRMPLTSFAAAFYYNVFSSAFRREQLAVMAGKRLHLGGGQTAESMRFTLRRNVHRLEKALTMRPRRDRFAIEYIEETVWCYERVVAHDGGDEMRSEELKWFTDVIVEYFSVVRTNDFLQSLQRRFNACKQVHPASSLSIPYRRSEAPESRVSYSDLLNLMRRRCSTRWFQQRPVPRELLDKAIFAGLQAPSACNRQPFEFRVCDDADLTRKIATIPMGTKGYSANIPCIVIIIGKLDAYFDERDRHIIYIDASLAAMSFMLALETLGLSSCPINWPDIEEREQAMDQVLVLKPWERPVMLMAVGYADPLGFVPYSQKVPLNAARIFQKPLTNVECRED
jgi:nitroreductase